ncbi:MAG: FecR domain-containing protein [Muribaculaceae bacterium]|nr:FecR domain-containing protein [Muribaculaceae bacterium]
MQNLITDYRNGKLSPEEMLRLRELMLTLTPDELDELMPDDAATMSAGPAPNKQTLRSIKRRIDSTIAPASVETATGLRHMRIYRAVATAAAVLLPLLIAATVYLSLSRPTQISIRPLTASTSGSGKTELSLPDGSAVTLRGTSSITYPSAFSPDSSRRISFEGQGYFNVATDSLRPMCVTAPGFTVTVYGTSFGISATESASEARVVLDSGNVTVTADKSSRSERMVPGDVATIIPATGELMITHRSDAVETDWITGELTFRNATPESLIATVENAYGIHLSAEIKDAINANFTGTLPWDDLATALKILSRIYGFPLPY